MKINNQKSYKMLTKFRRVFLLALLTFSTTMICLGQNQKITISGNNKTLLNVFGEIEKQSGLSISYNQTKLDVNRKIGQNFDNQNLSSVMADILKGTDFTYRIEGNYIIITSAATSSKNESKKISGIVLDETGQPIIGANVIVKGSTNGVISDLNGSFTLEVPPGSRLQISYIGYQTKEITVDGNKTNLTVQLNEDSQALDEVVVVGYGTEKKVNVIGSIAQINGEKLQNRSSPMLSNALTGQMSGVTVIQRSGRPGQGGGEIRVRGVGSFGGEDNKSDALVLIDGIPGSLNDINTEDVESISVLKDASTAAIYGSRAANGVILVTTKTGKEGKISVSYNGYAGFNTATELPEFIDTWQYATLYNEATGREVYTASEIQKLKDGSDPDHYSNSRYLDEVFSRKVFQTGHDLTLNGGNAQNKYMVSFGYMRQNGLVEKNDYSRYNARVNLINEIIPRLKLTTRLSGVYGERNEPTGPGTDGTDNMMKIIEFALRHPGIWPSVLSDGTFGVGRDLNGTPPGWIKSSSFYTNPKFSVNANIRLDYTPINDLKVSAIGAYTYTNGEERTYRSTMKLADDLSVSPSMLTHKMTKTIYKTFQATADYNKTINKHSFGVLAGYSWEQQDYTDLQGSRDKFPGNDLPYLNAGSPDNQKSSGGGNAWAIQSIFGRVKYNFDERYLIESTLRYDGSSRFPKNQKYGFFPSIAGGWRISEENFMKDHESLDWISNLKLKVSWGRLGNQNIGNYPYQSVYELGQNFPFGESFSQGAAIKTATDPTIKWEETETIDGGFESIFWNGLLSFNVSYFYRKTYDILYKPSGSVSSILGLEISEMNTGKLKTRW